MYRGKLDPKIEALVANYPRRLYLDDVNPPKYHKIRRCGMGDQEAPLWVTPLKKEYCVNPTGEVAIQLEPFLYGHVGLTAHVDYKGRWKYWHISDLGSLETIIRHFSEL